VVLGSTGEKAYVLAVGDNAYVQGDAPKDAKGARDYLPQLASILNTQNPSLALALASDPAADLIRLADLSRGAQAIDRGDDSTINGAKYPTLNVDAGAAGPAAVLAFDPTTKLLRRATYDLKPTMQRSGAVDVKTATLVIDYDVAKPGDGATGDKAAFAWAPPAGAKEVSADAGAGGADAAVAMQGKPAPDFTLKDLAGKDVKLSDLKGSVVVLDFWATWCGPCVASLPELDAVYKEKSAAGLKMFAVNQQEEKGKVQSFVTAKGLQIPVLLDVSGDAAAKYKVEGLPTTVVVDKEGVVRKVFVGVGPEGAGPVKKVVEELMK
jgi:peroxiredoxin